jgi:hypothetical protein
MSPQRIFGFALLVLGIILLVVGLNSSHSMADQISNTFTGRFTDNTTWYIIGGIVLALVGLSISFLGPRGKNV